MSIFDPTDDDLVIEDERDDFSLEADETIEAWGESDE